MDDNILDETNQTDIAQLNEIVSKLNVPEIAPTNLQGRPQSMQIEEIKEQNLTVAKKISRQKEKAWKDQVAQVVERNVLSKIKGFENTVLFTTDFAAVKNREPTLKNTPELFKVWRHGQKYL